MSPLTDLRDELRHALARHDEPGGAELCDALRPLLDGVVSERIALAQLKRRVYRLQAGPGARRPSLILKRVDLAIAQLNALVADRWLPAMRLGDRCAHLLVTAADRQGRWAWQVFEDVGDESLARRPERRRLEAAIELVAALHTVAATHPMLSEVRHYCKDLGMHYFTSTIGDAIRGLEVLARSDVALPRDTAAACDGLRRRLDTLLADAPRRARVLRETAWPDTMLHGDLWMTNVFVTDTPDGLAVRFIDWDRVGIGPPSYDLSTFLYRSPPAERPWIVSRYGQAVARSGWRLPAARELNLLFETAECARCASRVIWPVTALLSDGAAWAHIDLPEIERWFEALQPVLEE